MKKFLIALGVFFAGFSTANALPQINFSISPSVGIQNTEFTINARDSRNSSGNVGGIDLRCQYFYGQEWTRWSGNLVLKFRTSEIGRHKAKCQIRDRETGNIQTTYREFQVKEDLPRMARIKVYKTNLVVGEPVFFSLVIPTSTGENPDNILARWDFNSDGTWDTSFSRKKILSYAYDKQGKTSPTVEIKFPYGRVMTVRGFAPTRQAGIHYDEDDIVNGSLMVSSSVLQQPIVNISPGTTEFTEKTVFNLDASKSKVPRLGWMEWSIDGQQWMRFPRKKKVSFSFNSAGKHEVRTRVCLGKTNLKCSETVNSFDIKTDPLDFAVKIRLQNKTNSQISRVSVNGNIQHYIPVEVGDQIRFSAVVSRYGYLGKLLYRWDFESDGNWDTDFSKNSFTETNFDHLGEFAITVQVQSEDGILVQETKKIMVKINPKPTIYVAQKPGDSMTSCEGRATDGINANNVKTQCTNGKIFVGERVRFFPNFSSEATNQIRFDMDNDGLWESDFRGLGSQEWVFETAGEKVVKMQIRDRGKNVTTIDKIIQVYDLPVPKARVIVSKKFAKIGESIRFDATDSEGRKLRYFWDFDSSGAMEIGTWEQGKQGPVKISRAFRKAGEYTISLKVVDETGNGDQIFFPVIVQEQD